MPGNITWRSGGPTVAIQASGTGVQIANGSIVICSGIFYNDGRSGTLAFFGTAEMACASGFGAAVNSNVTIDLYMVPSIDDGTTFPTTSVSGLAANMLKGSFVTPVSGNVSRLRMSIEGIPLMPLPYQTWLQNNTGQTLASGWGVNLKPNEQAYT